MGAEQAESTLAYAVFVSLGMAMLFAYNSFVSSPDYIKHYYRYASGDETEAPDQPHLWDNMMSLVVVFSMVPNFVGQMFLLTPVGQSLRMLPRIIGSMITLTLSIVVVAVTPALHPNQATCAAMLLLAVAASGCASAFFQSSTFSLAALLSGRNVQGIMLGQGVSGTIASGLQIIAKLIMGAATFEDTKKQAYLFFGIGIGWMVVCLVIALMIPRIRYISDRVPEFAVSKEQGRLLLRGEDEPVTTAAAAAIAAATTVVKMPAAAAGHDCDEAVLHTVKRPMLQVCAVIKAPMTAVFLVFTVSLYLFPSIVIRASSSDWFGILIVFTFNCGDMIGRFACWFPPLRMPAAALLPVAAARFLIVPIVMLCVAPKVIDTEAVPYICIALIGLSNGYTGSLSMMTGPSLPGVQDSERASAGSAMSFSLLTGCSLGSLIALLVNSVTQ